MPDLPPAATTEYEFHTTPYPHQGFEDALAQWESPAWGWLMEMGTGKSKVLIDNMCLLMENHGLERTLIFAPKGMYNNWVRNEIPTHMPPRHLSGAIIHLWQGGNKVSERRSLEVLCARGEGHRIFVINTEAIASSTKLSRWIDRFIDGSDKILAAVDESSTIKNPRARRTKKLLEIGRRVEYRRILTGTPVTNSPLDLWSQFEFLRRSALGFRSFYSFRAKFAVTERRIFGGRSVEVVVAHRNTDKLSEMVATMATVTRKDILDLPPKTYTEWEVALTADQQRVYNDMRDYATCEIEEGRFASTQAVITQLLRMHQVVCGHITDELGEVKDLESNRVGELLKLLELTNGKVIIWCSYRRDVDKVVGALREAGRRPVRYDGQTSAADREDALLRFQGDAYPPWEQATDFVGTPHTGGYGTTLTDARTVIYYSNSYDLEKRLQSEDRAHRIGQTGTVTIVDMIARGTVDEKIIEILKRKENLANLIMDGPEKIRHLLGNK